MQQRWRMVRILPFNEMVVLPARTASIARGVGRFHDESSGDQLFVVCSVHFPPSLP